VELILHTLAAKDERLARHLETSTVFSGFSNTIQNDIAAIGDVVRYNIKAISAAPFVAAEVDESTDVTNKALVSCHYVAKSERSEGSLLGI